MRQYGAERLKQSGNHAAACDAHTEYFAHFMQQRESDITNRRQIPALDEIERDFDNIRAAWNWAIQSNNLSAIDRMLEALSFFSDMRGRWPEGLELFQLAMHGLKDKDNFVCSRLRARCVRLMMMGDAREREEEDFETLLEEHILAAQANHDPGEMAYGLAHLAICYFGRMDYHETIEFLESSFHLYSLLNDRFHMAGVLVWIGLALEKLAHSAEQVEGATAFLMQSLAYSREVEDKNELSWTAFHLGTMEYALGNYAEGDQYFRESEFYQRETGSMKALCYSLIERSRLALWRGQFEESKRLAEEGLQHIQYWNISSLEERIVVMAGLTKIIFEDYENGEPLCRQIGVWSSQDKMSLSDRIALLGLSMAAYFADKPAAILQYYSMMISVNNIRYVRTWMLAAPVGILVLSSMREFERATWLLARCLHLPRAINHPIMDWVGKAPLFARLRTQLETELGQVAFVKAWEHGKTLDVERTADMLLNHFPQSFIALPSTLDSPKIKPLDALTARELEILRLIADGLSNREIAEKLFLTLGTVRWYTSTIYDKLDVDSRTKAIVRARLLGLIP
jgi:DNA-binding CsgD family transcriptional regulator/tetratricopeptide (TPR) repeat protein